MKALILDVGNSMTKLLAWAGDHQRPAVGLGHPTLLDLVDRWPTPSGTEGWSTIHQEITAVCAAHPGQPLVTSTVVPHALSGLKSASVDLVVIDHQSEMPFSCVVDDPAAVGSDRFCNVAAAFAAGLRDALVVDVGTATTFDLLVGGVFIGGLIAPGPEFALQQLGHKAARLPSVPFEPSVLEAGKNTREAMARGGWNVGTGGINWCIEGLARRHGPLPILLTGGLGHHLKDAGRFHDPHLTLRGAAFLAGLLPD